jgi:hypothetical protein
VRWLAGLIMRGRLSAALIVAISVLVLPLVWLSGPALALVTLRRGPGEGALVMGLAAAGLGVLALALGGNAAAVVMTPLLYLWLPMLAAATVLRSTVSLAWTLQAIAGVAAVGVFAFHLAFPDPVAFWQPRFEEVRQAFGLEFASGADWNSFVVQAAPMMTGLAFTNAVALVVGSLLLARWWQALLYNPGGFRGEFHALRLSRPMAGAAAAALLVGMFIGTGAIYDVGVVLSSVFLLQALALFHAYGASRGWSGLWLIPIYLLLPFLSRLLSILGIVDAFVDLRRRFAGPSTR